MMKIICEGISVWMAIYLKTIITMGDLVPRPFNLLEVVMKAECYTNMRTNPSKFYMKHNDKKLLTICIYYLILKVTFIKAPVHDSLLYLVNHY